jgi:hypothetical protein
VPVTHQLGEPGGVVGEVLVDRHVPIALCIGGANMGIRRLRG